MDASGSTRFERTPEEPATSEETLGQLVNQVGALYPWRTINGEEASAYYAAGTAQYHINAAIAFGGSSCKPASVA